jgi:hypothetical protein
MVGAMVGASVGASVGATGGPTGVGVKGHGTQMPHVCSQ